MQYTVIACVLNILSIINDCIDILKSGKFFEDTLYNRTRKGTRCFSVSQVYQNPEQSEFGAALSFLHK